MVSNQLINSNIHHFLKSLIKLTQERDSFELEFALQQAMASLVSALTGESVRFIKLFRLRDITQRFLAVLNDDAGAQLEDWSDNADTNHAVCEKLLTCYNQGVYQSIEFSQHDTIHLFPLKNPIAYHNATLYIRSANLNTEAVQALSELLDIYLNYVDLMNDNERDTLTGLLNRKTFDFKFHKILSRFSTVQHHARETPQAYFLTIFDIDHFKRVNDVYGHLIGDEVLLLFSQLMTKTFRETDPLFRFGGEEFVGIFACAHKEDIQVVLNRFRDALAGYRFPQVGKVTVSIGCTQVFADSVPSTMIAHADQALYYAKQHGRDQICYYETLIANGEIENEDKHGEVELF